MKAITKDRLGQMMNVSPSKLRQLLNVQYIKELLPLGYAPSQRLLSPKIAKWVLDQWGVEY